MRPRIICSQASKSAITPLRRGRSTRTAAFKQAKKLLKQVGLFDVYRGDKIPAGKKQYALNFVIQDLEKTLTDQDTERVMERLLTTFQTEFGAQLR